MLSKLISIMFLQSCMVGHVTCKGREGGIFSIHRVFFPHCQRQKDILFMCSSLGFFKGWLLFLLNEATEYAFENGDWCVYV